MEEVLNVVEEKSLSSTTDEETANPNCHGQIVAEKCNPAAGDDELIADGSREKRKRDLSSLSESPLYKTSLCSYYRRSSGSCSHGAACRYAHGESELRPRPDKSWDPTSERAKKTPKLTESSNDDDRTNGDSKADEHAQDCEADGIMMTDFVAADGGCLDAMLSKCLVHLPRKWGSDQLKNFLRENEIVHKLAKKKKGMTVGFVSFESEESLKIAVEGLEGKSAGNKNIKVADIIPRTYDERIKSALHSCERNGSREKDDNVGDDECRDITSESVVKGRTARDVVTPLAHMSYADQLEQKKSSISQMLKKLTRNARKACPSGVPLPSWILKSREIGGLPCTMEGILGSPLVEGYRNKCEFSVGYSLLGNPTVGFLLGNFREGVTAVEEPTGCLNVSRIACNYASIFQEFLRQSDLPIWNRFKNSGFWRQLTVREGRSSSGSSNDEISEPEIAEVMLIIQVSTRGFDEEVTKIELDKLENSFVIGAAASCLPLTFVVVQDHQGISNVAPADAPLFVLPRLNQAKDGDESVRTDAIEPRIHDYINNLKFSVSPTAFFQVNTVAAEKLYSLAGEWADLGTNTLLFDICCGTGTIGLTLAHKVGMVVGIEMNASAVEDARRNAEINGIKNCRFVCGKAEDVMGSLLKEYLESSSDDEDPCRDKDDLNGAIAQEIISTEEENFRPEETNLCDEIGRESLENDVESQNQVPICSKASRFERVVAIVDPPRGGLHPTVIKVLRTHSLLRRVVYISCNPETLVANAIELCTPSPDKLEKGNKGNRGWRRMSSAGLARHRAKSMPLSDPFCPIRAMAVDLFPHTAHCEMVLLLER